MWFRAQNKWFLTAVYLGMVGFVLAGSGPELQERFQSITSSKEERDESAQSRLTTWKIAIQMANEKPFFGFGVRNSNLFTLEYGADMEGRSIHSQYLQTAADSGWIAMGWYMAMLASTFLGIWWVRFFLRRQNPITQKHSTAVRVVPAILMGPITGTLWYHSLTRQDPNPEIRKVRSLASGLECSLFLFCIGAVFLSLEHFEMPYIILVLAMQLTAITRQVAARGGHVVAAAAPSAPVAKATVPPSPKTPATVSP